MLFHAFCRVVSLFKILLSLASDVTTFAEPVLYILYIFENNFVLQACQMSNGPMDRPDRSDKQSYGRTNIYRW